MRSDGGRLFCTTTRGDAAENTDLGACRRRALAHCAADITREEKRMAPGRGFQSGQPRCRPSRLPNPEDRFQYSARRFQRRAATLSSLPRSRLERQGLP
jgi:hypothetical protein